MQKKLIEIFEIKWYIKLVKRFLKIVNFLTLD